MGGQGGCLVSFGIDDRRFRHVVECMARFKQTESNCIHCLQGFGKPLCPLWTEGRDSSGRRNTFLTVAHRNGQVSNRKWITWDDDIHQQSVAWPWDNVMSVSPIRTCIPSRVLHWRACPKRMEISWDLFSVARRLMGPFPSFFLQLPAQDKRDKPSKTAMVY